MEALKTCGAQDALLLAQVSLAHTLQRPRSWIAAHPEYELTPAQHSLADERLARLCAGEPLPHVIEQQDFFGLSFYVTPQTLIPRPETEMLVEEALRWLAQHPAPQTMIDVGTGSGCIAVAVARHAPGQRMFASDRSAEALQAAQVNLRRHRLLGKIALIQADLLQPFHTAFDLILANLPYIPSVRLAQLEVARHEPRLALDGGEDGLTLITRLLQQAVTRLSAHGLMLLEIDETQEETAAQTVRRYFPDAGVEVKKDLSGLPRLLRIERSQ